MSCAGQSTLNARFAIETSRNSLRFTGYRLAVQRLIYHRLGGRVPSGPGISVCRERPSIGRSRRECKFKLPADFRRLVVGLFEPTGLIPADGRGLAIQLASVADKCSANLVGAIVWQPDRSSTASYRQADPLDALERSRRPISGTHHRDRGRSTTFSCWSAISIHLFMEMVQPAACTLDRSWDGLQAKISVLTFAGAPAMPGSPGFMRRS
jgi:hypothetical protein